MFGYLGFVVSHVCLSRVYHITKKDFGFESSQVRERTAVLRSKFKILKGMNSKVLLITSCTPAKLT